MLRQSINAAATSNGVNGSKMKYLEPLVALNIISLTPIVDTIDDSLIKVTNSLPKAGKMFFNCLWHNYTFHRLSIIQT